MGASLYSLAMFTPIAYYAALYPEGGSMRKPNWKLRSNDSSLRAYYRHGATPRMRAVRLALPRGLLQSDWALSMRQKQHAWSNPI